MSTAAAEAGLDTFALSWNGDDFNCQNNPGPNTIAQCTYWAIEVQNYNGVRQNYPQLGSLEFLSKPLLNQWYHVAVVMQMVDTSRYTANWAVYVNGGLAATLNATGPNPANMPLPIQRPLAYIGQSDYTDPSAPMMVDTLRIYDYTLSQAQIAQLSSTYGLNTLTSGDSQVSSIVPVAPVFNADFASNLVPTNAYSWAAMDASDSIYNQVLAQGCHLPQRRRHLLRRPQYHHRRQTPSAWPSPPSVVTASTVLVTPALASLSRWCASSALQSAPTGPS